ncbi:MAG: hypothetical protein GC192_24295 [Bacteroidetes bacterium]|nr:hypothetical protein [Bacteroidota bacterium]
MKKTKITLTLAFWAIFLVLFCGSCGEEATSNNWKHNDNTARVRLSTDITTLNPFIARSKYERLAIELIYQCPMNFDFKTLALVPQLIKATPVVKDITEGEFTGGQSFTYEIFPEAVWDDGQPVIGNDFLFTAKALFNPKTGAQRFVSYIESVRDVQVDASNPKLFTVFTDKKYFLNTETISNINILPEHIYDADGLMKKFALKDLTDPAKAAALAADPALQQFGDAFNSPKFSREIAAGSGPYKLAEWVDGQRVVLVKKQNWWGEKLAGQYPLLQAFPDTVTFIPIPDAAAAIAAVKDESVDVAFELDSKMFNELRQLDFVKKVYNFFTPPTYVYYYTAMQNRNPKLADKRVRRALAETIDMDMVIKDFYEGLAERAVGPFANDKPYIDKTLKPIAMNLDDARKLLAEAGWTDSNGNGTVDKTIDGALVEMKLQYLYSSSNFAENYALLLKNNAQKIGIEIELAVVDPKVLSEKRKNGDYELAAGGAGYQPIPDDPKQFWHTDGAVPGGSNYARFGDAKSDAIIDGIQNSPDEATRTKLYKEFQQVIYDEQPFIFLFSPQERIAIHQRFEPEVSRLGISLQHLKLKK